MNVKLVSEEFIKQFQNTPLLFQSPGRINLIGEHTDYNDGFVLPAAIDKSIVFAIQENNVNKHRFYSIDLDEYLEIDIDSITKNEKFWSNYLIGVIAQFQKREIKVHGLDCVFSGDIPLGAGLSSSAALECGFTFAINDIFNCNIPKSELIFMAQKAEHEFAGVNCGIMDQFASMFGKEDKVIQLDCRSLDYQYFPLDLKDYTIILCDTNVKHSLASSEYNTRRKECQTGVEILKKFNPNINSLRDVTIAFLKKHKTSFNPVIFKRCKYVVEENSRVLDACDALQKDDLARFGKLMFASHEGLKNEYEVSCIELDFLVDKAKDSGFVIGSRMMGGGFGGCTINLVKNENKEQFIQLIDNSYYNEFDQKPSIFDVKTKEGSGKIYL